MNLEAKRWREKIDNKEKKSVNKASRFTRTSELYLWWLAHKINKFKNEDVIKVQENKMSTLHELFQASKQFHKTKITKDRGKAS
jgi:hypothetical protein